MKKYIPLLLLVSGSALADDAAILKCRTLADTASRLSCYDAIPVGQPAVAAMPAAAATPAVAATPAAAAKAAEQNFGIETMKKKPDPELPKEIASTIPGDFEGWGPSSQIRLANGQVWRIVDGSEAVLPRMRDAKVRIVRNMFGTLFLKVEGTNNSAKVRRVQ